MESDRRFVGLVLSMRLLLSFLLERILEFAADATLLMV
jgi:hypothetical protein